MKLSNLAMPTAQTVATSFSRAAQDYDRYAGVQTRIAKDALGMLPVSVSGAALDIGCGPGTHTAVLSRRSAYAVGVDIAPGMLQYARQQYPHVCFVQGDACALPFADNQFQLIFSSMAMQWCHSPTVVLQECQRVLQRGGEAVLGIMVAGSLWQLQEAQQAAGLLSTVHRLPSAEQWWTAAQRLRLCVSYDTRCYEDTHPDFSALLHSIGKIGASIQVPGSPRLTKSSLQTLRECYRRLWVNEARWSISYKVLFLRLQG